MNKKVIKILIIVVIILIIGYLTMFLIDRSRVENGKVPIFNISMYEESEMKEYKGLGYKTVAKYSYINEQNRMTSIEMYCLNKCIAGTVIDYNEEILNTETKEIPLEDLPENYTMVKAIDDGCFVITNTNQIYNKNKLDEFISKTELNAKNRKEAFLRIVQFTTEGDMVITDISYNIEGDTTEYPSSLHVGDPNNVPKSNYIVKIDSTRDKFAGQEDRKVITLEDFPGDLYGIVETEKNNIIEVSLNLYAIIDYASPDVKQYEDYFVCAYSKQAEENAKINEDFIIVDISKDGDFSFAEELEEIYRDNSYKYSLPCIKSEYIIVRYKNGAAENIVTALRNKNISITDLDRFNIDYIKEKIEDTNENSFFGTIIEANESSIIVEPYESEQIRRTADKIYIGLGKNNDAIYKVGTNVKITYSGYIMESYPAQVRANKIEIKSVDKFSLVFYQKTMIEPKQKEIIISKGEIEGINYNVYAYEGHVAINLDSDSSELSESSISLREALLKNKITMNEIIEKANQDYPNAISYDDGGSIEYHYDNYTIIKLHRLDGNRDVYIGTKGMKLNDVL